MKRVVAILGASIALAAILPGAQRAATQPSPPSGPTGIAFSGSVQLAWQPVAGASGYTVYRGTSAGTITTALTAALSMTIASQWMQPVLSLLLGIAVGFICGGLVWCAVRIWPIVRLIWWWTGELLLTTAIVAGWVLLNRTPLAVVATVLALIASAFVVSPPFPPTSRKTICVRWMLSAFAARA